MLHTLVINMHSQRTGIFWCIRIMLLHLMSHYTISMFHLHWFIQAMHSGQETNILSLARLRSLGVLSTGSGWSAIHLNSALSCTQESPEQALCIESSCPWRTRSNSPKSMRLWFGCSWTEPQLRGQITVQHYRKRKKSKKEVKWPAQGHRAHQWHSCEKKLVFWISLDHTAPLMLPD